MKRLLVLTLALAVAAVAFADEALVLPQGVLRVRVTGAYTMATQAFDADGEKVDITVAPFPGVVDTVNTFNIGASVEYGIVKGVNIAVQWLPGYILYSKLDSTALDKASLNGAFDIFAGAKVQILGDQGLVKKLENETMRFAAAAGAIIPVPGADWEEETTNLSGGKDFLLRDADRHAWGIGGRAYFDYVVNEMFFVNLYSEYIKFLKVDAGKLGAPTPEQEYDYGYRLTLEAEPRFERNIATDIQLKVGLPVTYKTNPEVEVGGTAVTDTDSYTLDIRPYAALFVRKRPLPLELEVGYRYPLAGKNGAANSAITFQLKAYYRKES